MSVKLKYLGTAAAEGVPAIFCTCENCAVARKIGGRNIRSRSQSLIDGELLIDFCADTYYHSMRDNIDLTNVHNVLITHVHSDHFYPKELGNYFKGFANLPEDHPKYHFWGGSEMSEMMKGYVESERSLGRLCSHTLLPFTPTAVGPYTVTALPAHHGTETPFIYIIEKEGKRLLYAHDTGDLLPEVWAYLEKERPYFHLISMDCTMGNRTTANDRRYTHMGFGNIREKETCLRKLGCVDDATVKVVNHFSHNSPDINYEDRSVYEQFNYLMSYDGMEVEI